MSADGAGGTSPQGRPHRAGGARRGAAGGAGWRAAPLRPGTSSSPRPPSQTPPGLPFSGRFPGSPPLSPGAHGPDLREVPEARPPATLVPSTHVCLPPASASLPGILGGRGEQRGLHEAAFPLSPEQGHLRLHGAPHRQLGLVAAESRAAPSNGHRGPCPSPSPLPSPPLPAPPAHPPTLLSLLVSCSQAGAGVGSA